MSIISYSLFVIFFFIIEDKSRYAREPYYKTCKYKCNDNSDNMIWYYEHKDDSYIIFLSSSLACFILGIYQIAGSVIEYNQCLYEESEEDIKENNNENQRQEAPIPEANRV